MNSETKLSIFCISRWIRWFHHRSVAAEQSGRWPLRWASSSSEGSQWRSHLSGFQQQILPNTPTLQPQKGAELDASSVTPMEIVVTPPAIRVSPSFWKTKWHFWAWGDHRGAKSRRSSTWGRHGNAVYKAQFKLRPRQDKTTRVLTLWSLHVLRHACVGFLQGNPVYSHKFKDMLLLVLKKRKIMLK